MMFYIFSTEAKPANYRKKPRWIDGFAEDPFVFFTEDQKEIVDSIKFVNFILFIICYLYFSLKTRMKLLILFHSR